MGFPPRYSEQLIYRYYKHYQFEHEKKFPSKGADLAKRWKDYEEAAHAAAAKKKAEDLAEAEAKKEAAAEAKAAAAEKGEAVVEEKDDVVKEEKMAVEEKEEEIVGAAGPKMAPVVEKPVPFVPQPVRTDVVDRAISTYNGAKTAKYNWS